MAIDFDQIVDDYGIDYDGPESECNNVTVPQICLSLNESILAQLQLIDVQIKWVQIFIWKYLM